MSSPMPTHPETYRITAPFARAGHASDPESSPLPDGAFNALLHALRKFHHVVQNGRVVVPLFDGHIGGGAVVAAHIHKTPALKPYVFFKDGKHLRNYDDVVYPLEERGLDLVMALHRDEDKNIRSPLRLIISPFVLGHELGEADWRCRDVDTLNAQDEALTLIVRLAGGYQFSGARHIIQTRHIDLTEGEFGAQGQKVLHMSVDVRSGMSLSWSPSHRLVPQGAHDGLHL